MTTKQRADAEFLRVPYAKIHAPDDNVRSELTNIDELADSIGEVGLLQPIDVVSENGHFRIVAGYRRHAALGRLIEDKSWVGPVPVYVLNVNDSERVVRMLVENLQRVDLNPVDEALGIQRLIVDHHLEPAAVAKQISRSVDHVKGRLAICSLPEKALDHVRSGKMNLEAAVALAKASPKVQQKILKTPYDWSRGRIENIIVNEKADVFRASVVKAIKELGYNNVDTQAYGSPRGCRIAASGDFTVIKRIVEALNEHGCQEDDVVQVRRSFGEMKVHVTLYRKLTEAEDAQIIADNQVRAEERRQEHAEQVTADLPEHIAAWYEQCLTIEAQRDGVSGDLEIEICHVRAQYISELKPAVIGAAAIRSVAHGSAQYCYRAFTPGIYDRDALKDYILMALGLTVVELPFDPATANTEQWYELFMGNTKLMTRAAALELLPYNRSIVNDALLHKLAVEYVNDHVDLSTYPEFPQPPAELNDWLGDLGDSADDLTLEAIDEALDLYLEQLENNQAEAEAEAEAQQPDPQEETDEA